MIGELYDVLGDPASCLGDPYLTEWRFYDTEGTCWHACVEERSDGWWSSCCYLQEDYDVWMKVTVGLTSGGFDLYTSREEAVAGAGKLAVLVARGEIGLDGPHAGVAEFDPTRTDPHRPVQPPVGTGDRTVREIRDMAFPDRARGGAGGGAPGRAYGASAPGEER